MHRSRSPFTILISSAFCVLAAVSTDVDSAAKSADDFLVVDCLLPGQVRKLGRLSTYVTPRRPIRTAVSDCEIRGGEYVSHDRANYATALKIWLSEAEQGDTKAQNYVGEIYEKGLGREPDYEQAAAWYRKAAEQGYAPAQLNLGALYERGLGVEQDLATALNWYRRASGLGDDDELVYASSIEVTPETRQELEQLRSEVARQQVESERLREQLEAASTELRQLRQNERDAEREIETLREELRRRREEAGDAAGGVHLKEMEVLLAEREREIDDLRAHVEFLKRETARAEDENQDLVRRLEDREAALRARLERQAENQERLAAAIEQAAEEEKAVLQEELEQAREQEQALREQIARLSGESAALQGEVGRTRARLQGALDQLASQTEAMAVERRQLQEERSQLQAEVRAASEDAAALEFLEEQLARKEAELAAQRDEIGRLEQEIDMQQGELAQARDETLLADAGGPSIDIIDPPLILSRGGQQQFRAVFRSGIVHRDVIGRVHSPGALMNLTVNDRPQDVAENGMFHSRVPVLEQETPVSIVAVDEAGRRASLEFLLVPDAVSAPGAAVAAPEIEVQPMPRDVEFGRYYALVIGNNEYPNLPSLTSAAKDARLMADILKELYGFEVTLLINATRYQILSALNNYRNQLTDQDNLVIYYAGHGELDRHNQRGHWLPVDAERESTANWISNVDITDILSTMSARHVLVIADSCYSGAMTRSSLARLAPGMSDEARGKWVRSMVESYSRTALTSGGLQPVLDQGSGEHSIFAAALAQILKENEGLIEGYEIFRRLSGQVALAASRLRVDQVPEYAPIKHGGHEAGEFFFKRL